MGRKTCGQIQVEVVDRKYNWKSSAKLLTTYFSTIENFRKCSFVLILSLSFSNPTKDIDLLIGPWPIHFIKQIPHPCLVIEYN